MEKTPLELYETAYNLHYVERKIPEAISYYEKLIKSFPDSNECGYAAIQLQKIKTGNLVENIRKTQNSSNPLSVFSFILACLSLLACGAGIYYFKEQLKIEQNRLTLTTSAIGKMLREEDDDALQLLTELKIVHKDDITPFELSADIYRRNHLFQKAKEEYELFFRLNPNRQPSKSELALMENKSEIFDKSRSKSRPKLDLQDESDSVFNQFVTDDKKTSETGTDPIPEKDAKNYSPVTIEKNIVKEQKNVIASPEKSISKKHKDKTPSSSAPVNGLFLVDPDSLSYF